MRSPLAFLGNRTIRFFSYVGGVSKQTSSGLYWTFVAPFRGYKVRARAAIHQMVLVGYDAIPVVCLIAFSIGLIMAFQGAYEMRKVGAVRYVVDLVAVSMTRELGPLMTAIIVIGRSGSAFAAEIGTMKVSEELDALTTMGLNAVHFLLSPKLLAMLIMMPCLTTIADMAGVMGGWTFAYTSDLHMSLGQYLQSTGEALVGRDILTGLIKSVMFGFVITQIGCYEGFTVSGGPEGVGKSTTESVVTSIFMVVLVDMVFTALFYFIG
jgi:phospholipid/cholesterol/gamma-HCH transport system permease protein